MDPSYGITGKLLIWFFAIVSIFYATILVLYINFQQVVQISERIVSKNYAISDYSKRMLENLLSMEENEKKYHLLRKEDYLGFFTNARNEFEASLIRILALDSQGDAVSSHWKDVYEAYRKYPRPNSTANSRGEVALEDIWIPEKVINTWIQKISMARLDNQSEVENATRELNRRGVSSVHNALIGLGISSLVGLLGVVYLAYSMIRPLKELMRGIRSISKERQSEPLKIHSKDELGELASAFNEMADRLRQEEQLRSDFISMLSHEIRTPLTSIRESVNMIEEEVMGPINDRQRKFLEIAGTEIGRICDLLNHLMQASRLEPGALKLSSEPVDVYALVTASIDSLRPTAEAKNIGITSEIAPETPDVLGDAQYLQQVFLNLIGNAIKFSDPKAEIRVRVGALDKHNRLTFKVVDTGPGILEEDQSKLFNKFYRSAKVRDHLDGVGLGLSITKNIVEAHGGTIWVESQVGKGTTFGFTLPVVSAEAIAMRPKERQIRSTVSSFLSKSSE
ncbi:HAMP domain-containing sensor histidine kinase [Desulfatitalea tepidiphila]|uniref:HAMP domain-containing sensor histidine kinase n=1 Tax=Desulfatitalea tepidiphila TaxID=1185843 RepID=UPI0006B5A86A|nr:HAMP domain-containing sensor histidine kinase [Desulfatitalea tepidiphila]